MINVTIYMAVTCDEYEIPLFVTSNCSEMAAWCGCSKNTMLSRISKDKSGKTKGYKLIRINDEEESEGTL